MTETSAAKRLALIAAGNIVLSFVVPSVLGVVSRSKPTTFDQVLWGTLLFVALSLLECLYLLALIHGRTAREDEIWDIRDRFDVQLTSIRRSMRTLAGLRPGPTNIFAEYFGDLIDKDEAAIRDAVTTGEFRVDLQHLDLSPALLSTFSGRPQDVLRVVHRFADNDAFFDVHERQWFHQVYKCVEDKRITEVRRLLIYASDEERLDERSMKIVGFHAHTKGYDYQLMSAEDFEQISRDFRLRGEFIDFGVYGGDYLYRSLMYETTELLGVYSHNDAKIDRYSKLFDFCWDSSGAFQYEERDTRPTTIDDFLRSSPSLRQTQMSDDPSSTEHDS